MRRSFKALTYSLSLAAALLAFPAAAQIRAEGKAEQTTMDSVAAPGCHRPAEAKEAKVIDFDAGKATARLAVNLGSGRFKLVTIKAWDRPEDRRPLIPVIEAARITQGKLQFFTPNLNADPESAPDSFILMTDMGSGYVCWATPGSLLKEGAYPVADSGAADSSALAQGAVRAPVAARPVGSPEMAPEPSNRPAAANDSGAESGASRARGRGRL